MSPRPNRTITAEFRCSSWGGMGASRNRSHRLDFKGLLGLRHCKANMEVPPGVLGAIYSKERRGENAPLGLQVPMIMGPLPL